MGWGREQRSGCLSHPKESWSGNGRGHREPAAEARAEWLGRCCHRSASLGDEDGVAGLAVLLSLPALLTHLSFPPGPGRCPPCVCSGDRLRGPPCKCLYLRMERSSARCDPGLRTPWPAGRRDCFPAGLGLRPPTLEALFGSPPPSQVDDLELRLFFFFFFTSFCSEALAYGFIFVVCPQDPCNMTMLYCPETGLLDSRPCLWLTASVSVCKTCGRGRIPREQPLALLPHCRWGLHLPPPFPSSQAVGCPGWGRVVPSVMCSVMHTPS